MNLKQDELTNETLSSLYMNNFELAYIAIQLAKNKVQAGHDTSLKDILVEIKQNPHLYSFEEQLFAETKIESYD